ncbi:hypothetical protein Sjap_007670 [Stephania japonica]|uniref:Uncharacterized protein n=1 Tax=Stephania japonica TaxID=461633 RepID=A0AAP0JN15_9MAGN
MRSLSLSVSGSLSHSRCSLSRSLLPLLGLTSSLLFSANSSPLPPSSPSEPPRPTLDRAESSKGKGPCLGDLL